MKKELQSLKVLKKHLIGGLCVIAFFAAITSNLAIQNLNAQRKDSAKRKARPTAMRVVYADAEKAVALEVVSMKNCGPCKRLKPVLNDMIYEGYDIVIKKGVATAEG